MNRKPIVVFITLVCVGLVGTVAAQGEKPDAPEVAVGTAFTYQGQIKRNGTLFNGACAMRFTLWDAGTAGLQLAMYTPPAQIMVTDGVFAVEVDFGNQFKGEARWIQTEAKCADDATYTALPRIALNPTPYAISLMPGAHISGTLSVSTLRAVNLVGMATNGYAGVWGSSSGSGVYGESPSNMGVEGHSASGSGVYGSSDTFNGVDGASISGYGIYGHSGSNIGVYGDSPLNVGVYGETHAAHTGNLSGVYGKSTGDGGIGVIGEANIGNAWGVFGVSASGAGVVGSSSSGRGVYGASTDNRGVFGFSANDVGVYGESEAAHTYTQPGVYGKSSGDSGIGVIGEANIGNGWGVYGVSASGVGVYGATTTGFAGYFGGKVGIAGGSDLAESFNVSEKQVEPGTLLIIDAARPGHLTISTQAYDTKVAGIVSGAGDVRPGLTLHQDGVMEGDTEVAIAGRVYVKASAVNGAIEPGDLLTTSDVPGHAMKATDTDRAHGTIVGKAMSVLKDGTGLVLVLVNLQ